MNNSKELLGIIKDTAQQGTKPFDTEAEVIRVEGDTVWVHMPAGVDETPVQKTINAKVGDIVQVRVANGSAWLVGNASAPPTDDGTAMRALDYASIANEASKNALNSAATAKEAADDAKATADSVRVIAVKAQEDAAAAQQAAEDAETAAGDAQTSADSARASADNALTQLGYVEDVVGVLNWIAEHGTYKVTTDTEVTQGKLYFTRTGSGTESDPYVYTVVTNPTGNPSSQGWYELDSVDEAISNFIRSHVVLTDDGLYVMADDSEWKVLIASDGVYIIDPTGASVSSYKDIISLGKELDQYSRFIVDSQSKIDFEHITKIGNGRRAYTLDMFEIKLLNSMHEVTVEYAGREFVVEGAEGLHLSPSPVTGTEIKIFKTVQSLPVLQATFVAGTASTSGAWIYDGATTITSSEDVRNCRVEFTFSVPNIAASIGSRTSNDGSLFYRDGENSTIIGSNLVATREDQIALGRWNKSVDKAIVVGNGTGPLNARSNSLELDWSGNLLTAGDITDGSGNVLSDKVDASSLAAVATSGDYSDLIGTPSLAPVATSGAYSDLTGTPSLATVATSGSYNDLTNKPSNATTSAAGFMSAADKTKLDKVNFATGMTRLNYGDAANTAQVWHWGNTTNKVGVGAYNNTDEARYNLLARESSLLLGKDNTNVWTISGIEGNVDINNNEYKAGDDVLLQKVICAGFVTNSTKSLDFQIPLPKDATGRTATLNLNASNGLSVRTGSGGYLNGTQYINTSSGYTITVDTNASGLTCRITGTSAFTNVTNNEACSLTLNGSITFS